MSKKKVSISDADNNDDNTGEIHSNRETTSDHLPNKEGEGETVEKRRPGRPRSKPIQIVTNEMEEEEVYHTPTIHSAFSYSPKVIGKHKDKGKSKTNSNSISESSENNENNDPGKVKKSGKKVFPCSVCDGNVGVNSNVCGKCKKWTHFSCHVYYKGKDWKGDYRCPRCVNNLTGVLKKKVQIKRVGKKTKTVWTTEQKINTDANANEKGSKDRRKAKRGLETEKEENGETTQVKRQRNGKNYTEEEMEAYTKKLEDKHRRIIEEMHINFLEERDRLIRDRDAEIEEEGENDILGNSYFR